VGDIVPFTRVKRATTGERITVLLEETECSCLRLVGAEFGAVPGRLAHVPMGHALATCNATRVALAALGKAFLDTFSRSATGSLNR
jgi:hypothetical protein